MFRLFFHVLICESRAEHLLRGYELTYGPRADNPRFEQAARVLCWDKFRGGS